MFMRFNTNDAFRFHPQTSKIPYNIFIHNFNRYDFPEHLLTIMTADDAEIEQEIAKNKFPIHCQTEGPFNGNYQVWLAIACSRQDMSNLRLLEIAHSLSLNDQEIFFLASMFGNLSFLTYLTSLSQLKEVREKIKSQNFKAFWLASRCGHVDVIKYLINLASADDRQNMIEAENFLAFQQAAVNGHLAVIEFLIETGLTDVQKAIKADNFHVFRAAVISGKLTLIERLIQLAPKEIQNMIKAKDFEAFRLSARSGNLLLVERLIKLAPEEIQNMIKAENFEVFRFAARSGHLPRVEYLIQLAPEEIQNMIKAKDFEAFRFAARSGHLPVIELLIAELAPADIQNMIKAQDFEAFREATKGGHLEVIKRLIPLFPANEVQNIIEAQNFELFKKAAENESLDVINFLIEQLPRAKVQDMIKADDFKVFRAAAGGRNLAIIELLIKLAPTEVQNMIQVDDFGAFRFAVKCDRLKVIDLLIESVLPKKVVKMITAKNNEAFRTAYQSSRIIEFRKEVSQLILERLLSYHSVLAYAEIHVREYESCVNPFVDKKLSSLRAQKSAQEQQNSNAVFDVIDSNENKLLFYVLRNLIRRNEPVLHDNILFLLNLPSVKSSAHTKNNELLRLAMARNNQEAIGLLLNIPAVLQLAGENDFYRAEARGGINLRELAQSRESSMTALSQGEQKRLARAIDHYKPMIEATGVADIMTDLREILAARYEAHPATFVRRGQICELPLQWTEFQALELNQEERSAALAAYAKHKDHTAWRYLSKPNPWMHPEAAYVNVNPATHEMWSTFEEYQPVICLYYLAAIDDKSPPIDGYTLETRFEGFIDELALIARAHNWDHTRFRRNEDGELALDEDGNLITEEYDDLQGDRPSCYSGVLRRLFQSVRGHLLLIILTERIIDTELRDFVRSHFRILINPENRSAIHSAWDKIISLDKLTQDDIAVLTSLNISEEKQGQFIGYLRDKYQEQFTEDPSFLVQIKKKFSLKENEFHVQNFGHFFMDFIKENRPDTPHSAMGFFASNPSVQDCEQTRVRKKAKYEP